jgi:hypothetical protein
MKNEAKLMSSRIGETMTSGNEPTSSRIEIYTTTDKARTLYNRQRGSESPLTKTLRGGASKLYDMHARSPTN